MYIGKIEEAVIMMERTTASFTEEEKQQIALYAFKIGDEELIQKLVEELSHEDADRKRIFQKYFAIADEREAWIEQIELLLVSIELLRLKEKQALEVLSQIVKAYEKEISKKEKEDSEKIPVQGGDVYGRRNSGSGTDYPCSL